MSARYERVHAQDDHDDHDNDASGNSLFSPNPTIPDSPPPSFRSRTSSQSPHGNMTTNNGGASQSPHGNMTTNNGGGRRHGTASSHTTNSVVDPTLADAFDTDGDDGRDESDDEDADADDRQRLMRSRDALRPMRAPAWMTAPAGTGAGTGATDSSDTGSTQQTPSTSTPSPVPAPTRRPAPATASGATPTTGRVYGGGIQSDGVFSNLTARPEPGEEKDELPPVGHPHARHCN
jgi:hypothetical protein